MAEEFKYLDLSSQLKLDELYHIFKTNSSKINSEILSKLQSFNCSKDFFKFFISKDPNIFYVHMNNFISELSSLIEHDYTIHFNSNSEKYICDFSKIYFLFNIIGKMTSFFKNIISNAKSYLKKLYGKYQLDNNLQEKINEYIEELLDYQNNRIYLSDSFKNKNNDNEKEINNDIEKYTFQNEKKINPTDINNLNKNDKIKDQQNNDFDMQLIETKSQDTEFTFSKKNNEKENNCNINNQITKSDNKQSNNIKDYITNINPDDFIIRHPKKRRSTYVRQFNSKISINKVNSVDKILSTSNLKKRSHNNLKSNNKKKANTFKMNNLENHETYDNLYQSTGHLFIKEESKKYADLLEIIIELYKNDKISLEQKLKLKKMVISKSSNILKIYNLFNHDNEKFLFELKKLIY